MFNSLLISISLAFVLSLLIGVVSESFEAGRMSFIILVIIVSAGMYFNDTSEKVDCIQRSEYSIIKEKYDVKYIYRDHLVSSNDVYVYKNAEDTTKVKLCKISEINEYGHLMGVNYKIIKDNEAK